MKGNIPFFWRETILSLKRNLLLNIASASTVMVLTFILGFFILMVVNINNITNQAMSSLRIKVELSDQLSLSKTGQLKVRILKIPSVESASYVSKEEGFRKLKEKLAGKVELDNLTRNPIPNVIEVKVGKPMDEKWLKAHTTIYHAVVGTAYRDDAEALEYIQRIHALRTKYDFMPKE